jgi:hypothetical protein
MTNVLQLCSEAVYLGTGSLAVEVHTFNIPGIPSWSLESTTLDVPADTVIISHYNQYC